MMKTQFLLLTLVVAATHAVHLEVQVATSDKMYAGTDNDIFISFVGTDGVSGEYELDKGWYDDFEANSLASYSLNVQTEIGRLRCIRFSTPDKDDWLPSYAVVKMEEASREYYFYNTNATKVSADASDGGVQELELCEQGTTTYTINIHTQDVKDAGTDNIYLRMRIKGDRGWTDTGLLNNRGENDFKRGARDTFTIPGMRNVGRISCVQMRVMEDDAWLFTTIEITTDKNPNPRYFFNDNAEWMSTDEKEGRDYFELC